MIERRIKELSFALEALSRINGYDMQLRFEEVSRLLTQAIREAEEINNQQMPTPPAPKFPYDDIPF